MKIYHFGTEVRASFKSGFFKGVGLGAGLIATGVFAAAMSMNVFEVGEVLSSSKVNKNFEIAAPAGAIMAFYAAGCPDGWAPADGTNGTPDLRGRFIRGRDDVGTGAAGNDPSGSRAVGDVQADAFQGHRHNHQGPLAYSELESGGGNVARIATTLTTTDPVTDGTNGAPRTANETRPKNVALTYCMRQN